MNGGLLGVKGGGGGGGGRVGGLVVGRGGGRAGGRVGLGVGKLKMLPPGRFPSPVKGISGGK